jgi:LmbE family N-acetylglucosaminyl deacetylase
MKMTRRGMLSLAGAAVTTSALPAKAADAGSFPATPGAPPDDLPEIHKQKKLKVVFAGAHVDDWTICNGTLARYAALGHDVQIISLTPGNSVSMADVAHMTVDQMAVARRAQAVRGSKMIGASIRFLGENDLQVQVTPAAYQAFNRLLLPQKPDVVFTMWAIEFHPDHRAVANLAFNAWLQSGMNFAFFFCDNPGGDEMQPQQFVPNRYVSVGTVRDVKRRSFLANSFIKSSWPVNDLWSKFRGREYGCKYAEAFIRVHTVASMPPRNLYPNWWYWGGLRLNQD